MRTKIILPFLLSLVGTTSGCFDPDCDLLGNCEPYSGTGADGGGGSGNGGDGAGATGAGAPGGGGNGAGPQGGGGNGGGGSPPCGGPCEEPEPYCDEVADDCVACLEPEHCDSITASSCDGGDCVPCSDSTECAHLTDTPVCDGGTCVECALGEEEACGGGTTCDLIAKTCTGPAATSVQNCRECTNDAQCATGHRCIEMDFDGSAHGYYCLKDSAGGCDQPFGVLINGQSLSGVAATNYCGIDEDVVSCEAAVALLGSWRCSGTPGMCSPDGIAPEVPTPGALCRQVGAFMNRCTYQCGSPDDCPSVGVGSTCGGAPTPTWCGG